MIFSTIFLTYPIHTYYMAFNILSAPLALGLLFATIGYLMVKEVVENNSMKWILTGTAVLLLTGSFSVYQGNVPFYIVLVLVYLFTRLFKNEKIERKEFLRRTWYFLLVFIAAFLLYKIIDKGLRYLLIHPSENLPNYTDQFLGWKRLPFRQVIYNLLVFTINYLRGYDFYGATSIRAIFILIPVLIFFVCKRVKPVLHIIIALLLLGLIILSPFFVMYFAGDKVPARSLVALPFLLAFLWWVVYPYLSEWLKALMLVALLFVMMNNFYYTTRLFYSSNVASNADRDIANRIIERIYALDLPEDKDKITVAFVGLYQHSPNELFLKSDIFGASFFEWDFGHPDRMNYLFKTIGISNLSVVPKISADKIGESILAVPVWPNKGSVFLMNDTVVVKLSEMGGAQSPMINGCFNWEY